MSDETTLHESLERVELSVRRFRLVGVGGPAAGEDFLLLDDPVVLGRERGVDLRVRDRKMSRQHTRLEPTPRGWRVQDLGSANGTFIDGRRVEIAFLEPGGLLQLGESEFRLVAEDVRVRRPRSADAGDEVLPGVIGRSAEMRAMAQVIRKAAPVALPLLIQGESGTGKERLARALHALGAAPAGPYEIVDCTLLAGEHLRSELFGHVKGAFTGADAARPGAFERADGGTVFLDEVGELPLDLQPHLLRVLEQGEVRPLGGQGVKKVAVRVVSATHRDLEARVRDGAFRQDLYYRLSALTLAVPPLRARGDDVVLLAESFLPPEVSLGEDARLALLRHPWPGNVRELRNCIQRAAVLAEGPRLRAADLGLSRGGAATDMEATVATLDDVETRAIRDALAACGGNKKEAAKRLGIARSTFYTKLKKLGL